MDNKEKYGISAVEYEVTDSTNEQAKLYARSNDINEPILFIAEEQTKGRGRYSRKFYSKKGTGVYLSLLFKPNFTAINTTSVIALSAISMINAINEQTEADIKIKWVNDLILGERKLGGILIEGAINSQSKRYDYLIAGIGVNLYAARRDEEIANIATSLEEQCGKRIDKEALVKSFVKHFLDGLNNLDNEDLFADYKSRLITLNKRVSVKTVTEEYEAFATDLNRDYSLLITTPTGEQKRIFTGEVSVKISN